VWLASTQGKQVVHRVNKHAKVGGSTFFELHPAGMAIRLENAGLPIAKKKKKGLIPSATGCAYSSQGILYDPTGVMQSIVSRMVVFVCPVSRMLLYVLVRADKKVVKKKE